MLLDRELLSTQLVSWPPTKRGRVGDFLSSLRASSNNGSSIPSTACLSRRKSRFGGLEYQHILPKKRLWDSSPIQVGSREDTYVIIDEAHRAIYVANLKSATTTITFVFHT